MAGYLLHQNRHSPTADAQLEALQEIQSGTRIARQRRQNGGKVKIMFAVLTTLFGVRSLKAVLAFSLFSTALLGCSSSSSTLSAPSPVPANTPKPLGGKGTVDGGGGKGVLCKIADGTETLQLLDLYEYEVIRKETTIPEIASASTINEIAMIATSNLVVLMRDPMMTPSAENEVKSRVAQFLKTEFDDRLKPQRTALSLTADATVPDLPKNCEVVQIAIWQRNGEIALDLNLWEKLAIRDQAALKLHEFVYYWARSSGDTTSDETRWLIGSAFSSAPLQPRFPESMFTPNSKVLWCGGGGGSAPYNGPNFELYAQEEAEGSAVGSALYLLYTRDVTRTKQDQYFNSYTRTRVFVPGLTLEQLNTGQWPAAIKFHNSLKNYSWSFETTNVPLVLKIKDPSGQTGLSKSFCHFR